MWDKRVVGQSVTFKRNPHYWQKGKPYLDGVKWTYVCDQNTRELQLRGGQIQVDEFPPFNSIKKLQNTTGRQDVLFPSTRTDYLNMNEPYAPLADVHVRRAISYAIDRAAIVRAVLFGFGKPANSFMPPQVPFYDKNSPGLQYNLGEGEGRAREVEIPEGLQRRDARRRRRAGRERDRPDPPAGVQGAQDQREVQQVGHEHRVHPDPEGKYQLGFSYWTMDIADPDELVTFAVDPKGGAQLVLHGLQQPDRDQALAPGTA